MPSPEKFVSMHTLVILKLCLFFLTITTGSSDIPLTQQELRTKYGQENTSFNDGRSCYRECDGESMTCYYEFHVQVYDSMSGLCAKCENGTISDCFRKGCVPANGVKRTIMSINQQMPGPKISVCRNDQIVVDVTNHMSGQELTIHWHGLHQRDTPWFDGVPMVTQCPIFGGNTFRYVFEAQESGTHFYHAHSGVHRLNGLFGMLNVRDVVDPNADYYDYDFDEYSILLADWNNYLAENLLPGTNAELLLPDSLLINGFGTFKNPRSKQFQYSPIAAFYVEKGKKHRFRIGNVGAHICPFEFTIKGHNLTVIATDGSPIEPIVVDCLVSLPGERFDVVLHATNDKSINETLITVRGLTERCRDLKLQEFARIIFVEDINDFSPQFEHSEPLRERPAYESLDFAKISLNDPNTDCINSESHCVASLVQKHIPNTKSENLRNVNATVIPMNYEITYVVRRPTVYRTSGDLAMVAMMNKIANEHSPVPGLTQDDSAVAYCNENNLTGNCDRDFNGVLVCYCPHLIELQLGQVYEFVLLDDKDANPDISHSLHLHGFQFQVIDMGTLDQYESGQTAFANSSHWPVIKDTVTMPHAGFVRIRFRASNPGYWLFHCHLEYHMKPGMTATIKVGNRSDMSKPPTNFPTCGHFLTPVYENSAINQFY